LLRRPLLLALASAFLLLPAATASAIDCDEELHNGSSAFYTDSASGDIDESFAGGHIDEAWDEGSELYFKLDADATYSEFATDDTTACTFEDGDELVYEPDTATVTDLRVQRKAYGGNDGRGWIRYLDSFENTGAADITIDIAIYGNQYSDADAAVGATSSGDDVLGADDDWGTQIDSDGSGGEYDAGDGWANWQSQVGTVADKADRVEEDNTSGSGGANEDDLVAFFDDITLAPGQKVYYLFAWGIANEPGDAAAGAAYVGGLPPDLYEALSSDEVAGIRNWPAQGDVDRDGVLNSADNCVYDANADQANTDGEGLGDACDADDDNDGFSDEVEQAVGTDPKRADTDGDGVSDTVDQCPRTAGNQPNGCAGDDQPPTVSWSGPADNANLRPAAANTLEAGAADDRGVARVVFVDDGRVICEDTSAPYSCAYAPEGRDVGSNTLAAVAVDSANQTATAFRVVNLRRFAATRVTARTTPSADAALPFRFTTRGRVVLPQRVGRAQGCRGRVSVQIKSRGNTISTRRAGLSRQCTYRSRVSFRVPERLFGTRLSVQVRFLGNSVVAGKRAPTRRVRVG
jgi:hypothetical protein